MEREYRRTPDQPDAITPLAGDELATIWQDDEERKIPYNLLSGTPANHAASHQPDGSDPVGTQSRIANRIPATDGQGKLDTFLDNASTTVRGLALLAADNEKDATKAMKSDDPRGEDARTPKIHGPTHLPGSPDDIGLGTAAFLGADTPDGVPVLVDGKIQSKNLPPLAINDVFTVASQAAMLALDAQRGDAAVRTDINTAYFLSTDDPTILANWIDITPGTYVTSLDGESGVLSLRGKYIGYWIIEKAPYSLNEVVAYNGAMYYSTINNNSITPGSGVAWNLISGSGGGGSQSLNPGIDFPDPTFSAYGAANPSTGWQKYYTSGSAVPDMGVGGTQPVEFTILSEATNDGYYAENGGRIHKAAGSAFGCGVSKDFEFLDGYANCIIDLEVDLTGGIKDGISRNMRWYLIPLTSMGEATTVMPYCENDILSFVPDQSELSGTTYYGKDGKQKCSFLVPDKITRFGVDYPIKAMRLCLHCASYVTEAYDMGIKNISLNVRKMSEEKGKRVIMADNGFVRNNSPSAPGIEKPWFGVTYTGDEPDFASIQKASTIGQRIITEVDTSTEIISSHYNVIPYKHVLFKQALGIDFYIKPEELNRPYSIRFSYKTAYGTDDIAYIKIADANGFIPLSQSDLVASASWTQFSATFNPTANTEYKLYIFKRGDAGPYATFSMTQPEISERTITQGAAIGKLPDYSPVVTGFGTVTNNTAECWRIGGELKVSGKFTPGTSTADGARIYFPNQYTHSIATSKTGSPKGRWERGVITSVRSGTMLCLVEGAGYISFAHDAESTGVTPLSEAPGNSISGPGQVVTYEFTVPISQWAGSGTVGLVENCEEYASNKSTTDLDDDTASNYYNGIDGATFPSVTGNRTKTISFANDILPSDMVVLEIASSAAPAKWIPVGNPVAGADFRWQQQGANTYGLGLTFNTGSKKASVIFGKYPFADGSTYGAACSTTWATYSSWRYRVRKMPSGKPGQIPPLVRAVLKGTSAFSTGGAAIPFNAAPKDTNSIVNASRNRLTFNFPCTVSINACLVMSPGGIAGIYKTGVKECDFIYNPGAVNAQAFGNTTIDVIAGDYIEIKIENGSVLTDTLANLKATVLGI